MNGRISIVLNSGKEIDLSYDEAVAVAKMIEDGKQRLEENKGGMIYFIQPCTIEPFINLQPYGSSTGAPLVFEGYDSTAGDSNKA